MIRRFRKFRLTEVESIPPRGVCSGSMNRQFDKIERMCFESRSDWKLEDWCDIDFNEYLNHKNETVNSSMRLLKNAKIKTVLLNIFKVCLNTVIRNRKKVWKHGPYY